MREREERERDLVCLFTEIISINNHINTAWFQELTSCLSYLCRGTSRSMWRWLLDLSPSNTPTMSNGPVATPEPMVHLWYHIRVIWIREAQAKYLFHVPNTSNLL